MTEAKKAPRKTTRKTTAKTTRAKTAARKKTVKKTVGSRTKVSAALSSDDLIKEIDKLKDKLNKTLEKEIAAYSKAIAAAKKKVATAVTKVKTLQERVQKARDTYREKPTAAAKNRYAKARIARQEASEKLADLRTEERRLKDALGTTQAASRRQKKLEKGYLKLVAEVDKPKKRKTRKSKSTAAKVPGRKRGRPRKTATTSKTATAAETGGQQAGASKTSGSAS